MKINWRVRFKNPAWIIGFAGLIIAFVYQVLGMFDVVPAINQDQIVQLVGLIVNILAGIGVLVDPTTGGLGDSQRAMTYTAPSMARTPRDGYDWSRKIEDGKGQG